MNPLLLGAIGAGAYFLFAPKKKTAVQVTQVKGAGGVPVKVVTPISPVTKKQATGVSGPPSPVGTSKTVQKTGGTYAPPAVMTQIGPGQYQMPPIVVTPSGASSVAISSILDVQRALNTLGYKPPLQEDGQNGPKTRANVKQFQSAHGLVVDGSAGPATKAALAAALTNLASGGSGAPVGAAVDGAWTGDPNAPAPPAGATPIVANVAEKSGPMSVGELQTALNTLGASPPLKTDGVSGPKTVAAIKSFQLSHGLVADGIAGPKTRAAVRIALERQSGDVPMLASWGQWS